jgi:competence protein ComEC
LDEGLIAEREKGLLEALLLGYRGNIDADTYRAFERTGLLHFISLSGMHLGILVGMVWWLTARAGLLKRGRALVCIAVVMLFLVVVPPRAPTIRAAVICFIFFLSVFFRRHPNPLNSLSIAAIILLLLRPTNLFEVGWQLSFASVLGILFFAGGVNSFLHAKIIKPVSASIGNRWLGRVVHRGLSYAITIFGIGVTAWLGGAGILLYHFYSINPLTSVWTVVAFPLVACILGLGFLKIVIWFVFPSIAALMGILLSFLSVALIEVVEFLSRINFCEILVGQVPIGVVLLYYSGIAAIAWAWYLRPFARKITIASVAILVLGTIGFIKLHRMYPGDLKVTCLDVGHGQAVVMQSPAGTFLFDAGSQYNRNIGQRVIIPFLRSRGISRVDGIIISHDDIDHINGIVEIVKNCEVGNIYASKAFVNKSRKSGTAKYLAQCLAEEGVGLKPLDNMIKLSPGAMVEILWPDEAACSDESLSDNDKSVVSLIEFAGRRILLCADIEGFAQEQISERYDQLRTDVVVVPHHGSKRTGYSAFINGLGAEYLICSCGIGYFERLQRSAQGVSDKWHYTARDGAIFVCIDQDGEVKVSAEETAKASEEK